MTPTPLTPDQVIYRTGAHGSEHWETLSLLERFTEVGLVVVEATAPDTTPTSDDSASGVRCEKCNRLVKGFWLIDGRTLCENCIVGPIQPSTPTPEGLVPDPREPGTWLGRLTDVPDGWQVRWFTESDWNPIEDYDREVTSSAIVLARPPQATTSPPRWTIGGSGGTLLDNGKAIYTFTRTDEAQVAARLLNAAGAAAPTPQDTT